MVQRADIPFRHSSIVEDGIAIRGGLGDHFAQWHRHPPSSCSIPDSAGSPSSARSPNARPDARFVYAADDAFFPYGRQDEGKLVARVLDVMEQLIAAHRPDLVVIACNTASTLVLPQLRERFKVPFVGTVPAIKPACASSSSKLVSVLGTEATVKREYTRALIREYGNDCAVTLVGSPRLAELAEAELKGEPVSRRRDRRRDRALLRRDRRRRAPTPSCWPAPTIRCCSTA